MARLRFAATVAGICLTLILAGMPVVGNCAEQTPKPYTLTCWGVRAGMTLYAYSVALSDIASKHSKWLKINVIEGTIQPATWANPKRRAFQIAAGDNRQRWKFMSGKFGADKIQYDWTKVRYLFLINFLMDGLVTLDPKIQTFKDLKGKRVSFGSQPNTDFDFIFGKLLEYEGMTFKDLGSYEYMHMKAQADALRDGLLDACTVGYSVESLNPLKIGASPFARELAETTKLHYIDMNPDGVRHVSKLVPAGLVRIPAGSLKGQVKEQIGISKSLCFVGDLDLPDEVVTEIARLVYEHADEFAKYVKVGQIMSKDTMCAINRPGEEFHPAMWKFMQQRGIRNNQLLEGVPGAEGVIRQ
ncbi:MAG: ABC transporter substrate-binding protein [Desulfobacterales bacterium]|nr:ABC transporter substrate-binding protein [Desulfobacterales bacterium]